MAKEFAVYHQLPSSEISLVETEVSPSSPYPQTEQFIETFLPHAKNIITPTLKERYLHELIDTIHARIQSGKTTYGDNEFFSLANQITSRIFELTAFQTTQEQLQNIDPTLYVTTPEQSHQIYMMGGIKHKPGESWTEADGFIFQRSDDKTYIVGACEYTGELNLGDKNLIQYASPHKIKQIQQHRSGKVIHDAFSRHPHRLRKRIGNYVSSLFPEDDISPHIQFEKSKYFSVFTFPNDDATPPKINGYVFNAPLSSNDSYYTALSILHEIEYPAVFTDTHELPPPSNTPVVIDLSQMRRNGLEASAAD